MNDGMPQLKLTRSSHNLSNTTCFDVEQGWLVPTAVYDCVPGDRFNLGSQALIRTTALIKPAFTVNLQAKSASFFVAYRTIWKAFEDFFSGGRSGNAKIPLPVFNINDELLQYSIFDYFGLPCVSSNPINSINPDTTEYINALYLLAYLKIWNDYFRNPSLDIEIDVVNLTIYKPNDDTPYDFSRHTTPFSFVHNGISYIGASVTIFLRWCFGIINNTVSINDLTSNIIASKNPNPPDWQKRKYSRPALVNLPRDLFTSALPTASTSDPVSLGFSGSNSIGPITGKGLSYLKTTASNSLNGLGLISENKKVQAAPLAKGTLTNAGGNISGAPSTSPNPNNFHPLYTDIADIAKNLSVKGSGGFSSGIYPRELRLVFGLDLKQQIRNLSGNRYQDLLKAFYGVTTRDYRLNLAEYIGGSRYPIYTSEVLQTSETSNTPLGDQAGHAIGSGNSSHGSYFVEELGCILNLFWINSENIYSQELRRDWRKFSINDYFFPMFEKLGDQELLQEEICYTIKPNASGGLLNNSKIFGFVPRYSEYKFYNNTVKGGFRGNYRYWSQARFFYSEAKEVVLNLNSSFIKPNPVTFNRIFQTIDNDYTLKPYQVKFINNTIAFRPMEENTIGYLIDHF